MSAPNTPRISRNLEQQHKLAKDLIRAARDGDPPALARIRVVRPDSAAPLQSLKLSDAQLVVARESGFESWPRLVADFQERDVRAFCDAVCADNVPGAQQLLAIEHVRKRINDPMFDFGQRAAHVASKNASMLEILIAAGADVNMKSTWENGPYAVLDNADDETARFLLRHGAKLTPNVAARLGWLDELMVLVNADATLVHVRGGDGQQPLHEAKTIAIANFLLDHGAGIDVRCIDHQSTPAQYALADRPEICRRLIERGATPDIFMAARLGDLPLATRILDADPSCIAARISKPGYSLVPPSSIYCWSLGFGMSPHEVALKFDNRDVHDLLADRSPARVRLFNALAAADEPAARAVIAEDPSLLASLSRQDHAHLALAIFHEHFDAAELMLRLDFDPAAPGVDGGTALHAACWLGNVRMVELLLARGGVPLDARDPTHQSTPLGWAAFGSVHRRAAGADYPGITGLLVAAGADIKAVGNGGGSTLIAMAQGNPSMQEALRGYGGG